MAHFDENNPQYRCCCKACHVKTGAIIIAVLELIYAVILMISGVRALIAEPKALINIVQFGIALFFFVAVILLLVGVMKTKKNLIIPHLIWQIIYIILAITMLILSLVVFFGGDASLKEKLGLAKYSVTDQLVTEVSKTSAGEKVAEGQDSQDTWAFIMALIIILVVYGLGILLEIWWFLIVRGAYRYCRDKEQFQKAHWEGVPLATTA